MNIKLSIICLAVGLISHILYCRMNFKDYVSINTCGWIQNNKQLQQLQVLFLKMQDLENKIKELEKKNEEIKDKK